MRSDQMHHINQRIWDGEYSVEIPPPPTDFADNPAPEGRALSGIITSGVNPLQVYTKCTYPLGCTA